MHVAQIFVHPVKSLRGIEVKESEVDEYGFKYDRMYVIATVPDRSGEPWKTFNQRHEPRLVLINTAIEEQHILISYNHHEARLPIDPSKAFLHEPSVPLLMWGNVFECFDITDKVDVIPVLRQVIQPKVLPTIRLLAPKVRRIVGESPDFLPETSSTWQSFTSSIPRTIRTSFQDLYPCHFVTTASLEALQRRVNCGPDEKYHVVPQNFRPNLVVENDDPWVEDDWEILRIGGHEWFLTMSTPRCVITTVDTKDGEYRVSKEPRTSLHRFRIINEGKSPCFGRYMAPRDPNTVVRVGDPVQVLSLKPDAIVD